MLCNFGIYHQGWTAVTRHGIRWVVTGGGGKIADDVELYDTTKDWSQAHDLPTNIGAAGCVTTSDCSDQLPRRSLRKASTSSLISAAVLDRGWQKIGWESGRKRGDDEREETEDAERMRPSCVGDGEEPDPGHEASDREPRQ